MSTGDGFGEWTTIIDGSPTASAPTVVELDCRSAVHADFLFFYDDSEGATDQTIKIEVSPDGGTSYYVIQSITETASNAGGDILKCYVVEPLAVFEDKI